MRITLNGYDWKIYKIPSFHKEVNHEEDGSYDYGYCAPLNQQIVIRNGMTKLQTERTLIHELTHAVMESYRLAVPKDEEETAQFLEAFGQMVIDNKDQIMDKWEEVEWI